MTSSPTSIRLAWFAAELAAAGGRGKLRAHAGSRLRQLRADMALAAARRPPAPPSAGGVLIVDSTFPDPRRDSGSDRIVRLARMSAALGHPTVLASIAHRHWADVEPTGPDDLDLPPDERRWDPELFWSWVERSRVIWLSRPDVAGRLMPVLAHHREARRLVYDATDVYHVRIARKAELTGKAADRREARALERLERAVFRAADVTTVVTDDERDVVQRLAPGSPVEVIPNVHETRTEPVPPRDARGGLLFYGNYRHTPNVDAVRHLYDTIMPAVWQRLPELELTIVGDRLPEDLAHPPDERIRVVGWVRDLDEVVDAAVALVAPLRYGAGMKGKIGFAMANGLPVVTSPIGAEGMGLVDGSSALVGTTDDEIVDRCERVVTDRELWDRLSVAGREVVRSTLSAEALQDRLEGLLEP